MERRRKTELGNLSLSFFFSYLISTSTLYVQRKKKEKEAKEAAHLVLQIAQLETEKTRWKRERKQQQLQPGCKDQVSSNDQPHPYNQTFSLFFWSTIKT